MSTSKARFQTAHTPHARVSKSFPEKTMTQQHPKEECDINNIMKNFKDTGLIEHVNQHQGDYGDYSEVQDYQTSLNQVMEAQASFDSLPAEMRRRFDNDPGSFLAFVGDPANLEEMREMGLLPAAPQPAYEPEKQPSAPERQLDLEAEPEST